MYKTRFIISRIIALCLIVLCILSYIGLCFASDIAKWFLMGGSIIALISLFIYIIKYPAVVTVEKVETKIVEREVQVPAQVPLTAQKSKDESANMLRYTPKEVQEQKEMSESEAAEKPANPDSVISVLLNSLEDNHINVFERHLIDLRPEISEEEKEALFEDLVDIGLLAMDFVNIHTRTVCSYADMTKDLIMKQSDKNEILRQMDPSIRLSPKYNALSKILQSKLPGKAFLYSGYKL